MKSPTLSTLPTQEWVFSYNDNLTCPPNEFIMTFSSVTIMWVSFTNVIMEAKVCLENYQAHVKGKEVTFGFDHW